MSLAKPILQWPEFDVICQLTLDKVVPRLLLPLQSEGRSIKPCLVHGDCWDGSTGMDLRTGKAFIFDPCSFYGHNEYDTERQNGTLRITKEYFRLLHLVRVFRVKTRSTMLTSMQKRTGTLAISSIR